MILLRSKNVAQRGLRQLGRCSEGSLEMPGLAGNLPSVTTQTDTFRCHRQMGVDRLCVSAGPELRKMVFETKEMGSTSSKEPSCV